MPRCRQCQHALARPPHVWYRLLSRQGRLSLSCAPPSGRVPRAGLVSHRVAKHMFVYSICDVRLDSAVQAAAWTCTCPLLVHVCMLQWQSSGISAGSRACRAYALPCMLAGCFALVVPAALVAAAPSRFCPSWRHRRSWRRDAFHRLVDCDAGRYRSACSGDEVCLVCLWAVVWV
jgi:hypothetical protein